jgi:hypothetical protein
LFVLPDSYVDPENKDYGGENLRMPWFSSWAFGLLSFWHLFLHSYCFSCSTRIILSPSLNIRPSSDFSL